MAFFGFFILGFVGWTQGEAQLAESARCLRFSGFSFEVPHVSAGQGGYSNTGFSACRGGCRSLECGDRSYPQLHAGPSEVSHCLPEGRQQAPEAPGASLHAGAAVATVSTRPQGCFYGAKTPVRERCQHAGKGSRACSLPAGRLLLSCRPWPAVVPWSRQSPCRWRSARRRKRTPGKLMGPPLAPPRPLAQDAMLAQALQVAQDLAQNVNAASRPAPRQAQLITVTPKRGTSHGTPRTAARQATAVQPRPELQPVPATGFPTAPLPSVPPTQYVQQLQAAMDPYMPSPSQPTGALSASAASSAARSPGHPKQRTSVKEASKLASVSPSHATAHSKQSELARQQVLQAKRDQLLNASSGQPPPDPVGPGSTSRPPGPVCVLLHDECFRPWPGQDGMIAPTRGLHWFCASLCLPCLEPPCASCLTCGCRWQLASSPLPLGSRLWIFGGICSIGCHLASCPLPAHRAGLLMSGAHLRPCLACRGYGCTTLPAFRYSHPCFTSWQICFRCSVLDFEFQRVDRPSGGHALLTPLLVDEVPDVGASLSRRTALGRAASDATSAWLASSLSVLEVFVRSFLLLQLLAYVRLLLTAMPFCKRSPRTNQRLRRGRRVLSGAPFIIALAFCIPFVQAARHVHETDPDNPSPLPAPSASYSDSSAARPDSMPGPSGECSSVSEQDWYFAVQLLAFQREARCTSVGCWECSTEDYLVEMAEDRFAVFTEGLRLVPVRPQPHSVAVVVLTIHPVCEALHLVPVCFQLHLRGMRYRIWQDHLPNYCSHADLVQALGAEWAPGSRILIGAARNSLGVESSTQLFPGDLVRIVPPGRHLVGAYTLAAKLAAPATHLGKVEEYGYPEEDRVSLAYALVQPLAAPVVVQYSPPIRTASCSLDEVLNTHASTEFGPTSIVWPDSLFRDALFFGKRVCSVAGAFPT